METNAEKLTGDICTAVTRPPVLNTLNGLADGTETAIKWTLAVDRMNIWWKYGRLQLQSYGLWMLKTMVKERKSKQTWTPMTQTRLHWACSGTWIDSKRLGHLPIQIAANEQSQ